MLPMILALHQMEKKELLPQLKVQLLLDLAEQFVEIVNELVMRLHNCKAQMFLGGLRSISLYLDMKEEEHLMNQNKWQWPIHQNKTK